MILPNADFERPTTARTVPQLVGDTFRQGGWLEAALGLEHRPQQENMARRVAHHFSCDTPILFEAGTGVGKSLAYLVPGILFAVSENRPLIVSSHTIALQEQILNKDLGICRELFNRVPELRDFAGFKSGLLIGRGNYLCAKRLKRAQEEQSDQFENPVGEQLQTLEAWSRETVEGVRQELNFVPAPEVWEAVNADASACNRKECPARECFYHRARARVEQSHVIILNHSLLFSLLNAGMSPGGETPGVLLPHDRLVLDEAHTVPSIATRHLGMALSSFGLNRFLRRLYAPEKNKGFLMRHGDHPSREAVATALEYADEFFGMIEHNWLGQRETVRITEPNWIETPLRNQLAEVFNQLKRLTARVQEDSLLDEFHDFGTLASGWFQKLSKFLAADDESLVYWLERSGARRTIVHLNTAPLEVGPALRELLFSRETGLVLTSATLDTGDDCSGFKDRVGAGPTPHACETSPFDYENQVEILLASNAPEPGYTREDPPPHVAYWHQAIVRLASEIDGGSLCLFTSFRDLSAVHRLCERDPRLRDRKCLVQRAGTNRSLLLDQFRNGGNALLFGTESFWTGIDVPGPALSQVIVTRLPFENPNHPVAEARSEFLRSRGENPFVAMTLPEAVLKFRQGIGRLVRTSSDTGRIVVLDSRILRKPYGSRFIAVLPKPRYTRFTLEA